MWNKTLFSERLAEQRKKAGYNSQEAFAKEYIKYFPPKRRDDSGGNEGNYKGILGTIKHYENVNWPGSPKLAVVYNMCTLLGCDIDYLTGKIDHDTHELDVVCNYTGLDQKAVVGLDKHYRDLSPFGTYALNALFSSSEFDNIVENLATYFFAYSVELKDEDLPAGAISGKSSYTIRDPHYFKEVIQPGRIVKINEALSQIEAHCKKIYWKQGD